ncbi:MAG: hypothetical protein M8872_00300 [marine benthic group bacterium]|nr:hypothetical protein [Gemmatimonadota bacterium]MCL7983061.1 hypothetical protein [Gemmatimonadota bacterium]MCL7983680.1 hypothetical protein [Gemmatimonadota bacterium]
MNVCPLCHRGLPGAGTTAFVPVSPVIYPGVAGLEVHDACLAAARRGEFDVPRPRSSLPAIAGLALLALVTATLLIFVT